MNYPIRVAQIMGKMAGGGVEAFAMNYYRNIDRRLVQFDFIVDDDSTYIPIEEIESLGGRVIFVPPYQDLKNYQTRLFDLFNTGDWKIVHSNLNTLSVFPLQAARRAGVPVRIAHSHSTLGRGEFKKNILKRALRPFSKLNATHLFACSKHAGDWLFGADASYTIIDNAIEVGKYAYNEEIRLSYRKKLGFDGSDLVVGTVGRLEPQKNHAFLLESFALLIQRRKDAKLVIVGSGSLLPELKKTARRLGIDRSVFFLGQREDIQNWYQAFDVFALASTYEGLGIVAIEAQAAGLPCILSDNVPEEANVLGECQFMDLSSHKKWVDGILGLSSEGDRCVDPSLLNRFDISYASKKLENKYREMVRDEY